MRIERKIANLTSAFVLGGGVILSYGNSARAEDNAFMRLLMVPVEVVKSVPDFAQTVYQDVRDNGASGVWRVPAAGLSAGLRGPEAVVSVVTGDNPRELGKYNPLAEKVANSASASGYCSAAGAAFNFMTPGFGAAVCGAAGLVKDAYDAR